MRTQYEELDVVRIIDLREGEREFSGSEGVSRAPRVGDIGTIVHTLKPGEAYIVECVDSEGWTIWVADFLAEELEQEASYGRDT